MTRVHNIHVHREDVGLGGGAPQPLRALQPVKIAVLLAFLLRAWRKEEGEVAYLLL